MRTPLRRSEWLSSAAGADVSLKLETLQPTFSYKIRGALNAVLVLLERGETPAALVTASAGNHGRALAYAAAVAGLPLTVYVPEGAPRVKLDALRRTGATIVACADYDTAERRAKDHGATAGVTFVSPYSHEDVIAGAGTVALEILADDPGIDTIVAAVGGGGLISGIAVAAQNRAMVYGVEAESSSPFAHGLAAGRLIEIVVRPTLADGLAGNLDPETITFDLVRQLVTGLITVDESEISGALRGLVGEERLIAEGAAATAVAGVLSGRIPVAGRHVAVVLSGANIDRDAIRDLLDG